MTSARFHREDSDGLCTLTLDRPDKLNALDSQAFDELDGILADLEKQTATIGCIVLRANGRAFCAGADLTAMGVRSDGSPVDPAFKPGVISRLANLPQPVIAAVHGACVTGGLELALACDFIIADPTAKFADTHGKWGLVGAWGIMQRLPRRVGMTAARRMMMTGCQIDGQEALRIGLIDELAAQRGLADATARLAGELLGNSWHTVRAIKRTLFATDGMGLAEALAFERSNYPGSAPDHADRVARFKRN